MGLFAPRRSEIESVLLLQVVKVNQKVEANSTWSLFSKGWTVNFLLFAHSDLEMINKHWGGVLKGTRIEGALKELAAYYLFRMLSRGDAPDPDTFVREASEILDLSVNQHNRVAQYLRDYGRDALKKYFDATEFTPELQEEFASLGMRETKDLLGAIASAIKDVQEIPLPNDETVKQIHKERAMNGLVFIDGLTAHGVL
jgi:hypothetical protein